MKAFLSLFLLLCGMAPAFAQQTRLRLVSAATDRYLNGTMMPADSTRYFSSGNNVCDLQAGLHDDSELVFRYDAAQGAYTLAARNVHVMTAQGFESSLRQDDSSGTLENRSLHRYAYLPGNAVMDTLLVWNRADSTWDLSQLCADTLIDEQHIKVHVFAEWNGRAWVAAGQTQHSYTASGKPDTVLDQSWDAAVGDWTPSVLMKYTYDALGRATGDTVLAWDVALGHWHYQFCEGIAFNAAGDTGVALNYGWDSTLGSWTLLQRQMMQLDGAGNVLWREEAFYIAGSSMWMNGSQTRNEYNSYGQLTASTVERWNVLRQAWEFMPQSTWSRYHYEEFTPALTVGTAQPGLAVRVYPNPAQDRVWVDWKGTRPAEVFIRLSDLQGRPVLQWRAVASELHEALSTAGLAPGTYLLQFGSEGRHAEQLLEVVH